jgi:hypothetical protein
MIDTFCNPAQSSEVQKPLKAGGFFFLGLFLNIVKYKGTILFYVFE